MGNSDIEIETLYEDLVEKWVRQSIHMGYSPKKLLKNVFDTIDKELDFGEKKMVLYCGAYGGYNYSKEFAEFIKNYNNKKLDGFFYKDDLELGTERLDETNDREVYHYIEEFAKFLKITPEEALERASGSYCKLRVKAVPKHRDYRIHEYDGCENVEILKDFSK